MCGDISVEVYNPRIRYEFTLHRNVTVLADEGATGKTSLIRLIDRSQTTASTKVRVSNSNKIVVLDWTLWETIQAADFVDHAGPRIYVVDESMPFLTSGAFADFVWNSGCYFILITRDNLSSLSCSVKEVYKLKTVGRTTTFVPVYPEVAYGQCPKSHIQCITEDSRFGNRFFAEVYGKDSVVSAGEKDNVENRLKDTEFLHPVVIVDGAAFGFNMPKILNIVLRMDGYLLVEESFEYVLLTSGIFSRYEHQLEEEMQHMDCSEYITWERFFNSFLERITTNTRLRYKKDEFNSVYLLPIHRDKILRRYGLPNPGTLEETHLFI